MNETAIRALILRKLYLKTFTILYQNVSRFDTRANINDSQLVSELSLSKQNVNQEIGDAKKKNFLL